MVSTKVEVGIAGPTRARRSIFPWVGILLVCALACLQAQGATREPSPRELIIERTGEVLTALEVSGEDLQRNPTLARKLTEDRIAPLVDFGDVARRVLGPHWRTASAEQRERFVQELRSYAIRVMATAMVAYTDEILSYARSVRYPPVRTPAEAKRVVVPMIVQMRGGASAEVRYVMRRGEDGWKIHDVTVLGVSLVSTYRNSFAAEIQEHGLEGLIDRLAQHNRARDSANTGAATARDSSR